MKNRNNELDPEPSFDYDDYDEEQALKSSKPAIEVEDPYEDYDIYDVVITETVTKKIAVFAKNARSAQAWIEDTELNSIDMEHDIDTYERTATAMDSGGSSSADVTVPLWWYEEDKE